MALLVGNSLLGTERGLSWLQTSWVWGNTGENALRAAHAQERGAGETSLGTSPWRLYVVSQKEGSLETQPRKGGAGGKRPGWGPPVRRTQQSSLAEGRKAGPWETEGMSRRQETAGCSVSRSPRTLDGEEPSPELTRGICYFVSKTDSSGLPWWHSG